MSRKPYYNGDDFNLLKEYGYTYSITEGGWISPMGAIIIIDNRRPYIREVQQRSANDEAAYIEEVKRLQEEGLIRYV